MHRGNDVHAWTPEARLLAQEIAADLEISLPAHEFDGLFQELFHAYAHNGQATVALRKMRARYDANHGGYFCPDTQLNISCLLHRTWQAVRSRNDPEIVSDFGEILAEIGSTCVQGDSHRLLFYYQALTS